MRKRTIFVLIAILLVVMACSLFLIKKDINGDEKKISDTFVNVIDSITRNYNPPLRRNNDNKELNDITNETNINIKYGIPKDSNQTDDIILYKSQYVVSFNPYKHIANWVSWNLNSEWYGDVDRYNKFIQDPDLPDSIYQATDSDYKKTGYDRGHIVRSEERTKTIEDNISTFYYTNIFPQIPALNRTVWLDLERYCESLSKGNNMELYIIAGSIFGDNYSTLNNNIAIPDSCYKIILILNNEEVVGDISDETEVIAVIMPNDNSVRKNKWYDYTTSVRRLENSTGYDFLSNLPREIQDKIENKIFEETQTNKFQNQKSKK